MQFKIFVEEPPVTTRGLKDVIAVGTLRDVGNIEATDLKDAIGKLIASKQFPEGTTYLTSPDAEDEINVLLPSSTLLKTDG